MPLPNRLLPECALQKGVAPQARRDLKEADAAAQKALAATAVFAERKRFRPINQPLLMTDLYGKNNVYGDPTAE